MTTTTNKMWKCRIQEESEETFWHVFGAPRSATNLCSECAFLAYFFIWCLIQCATNWLPTTFDLLWHPYQLPAQCCFFACLWSLLFELWSHFWQFLLNIIKTYSCFLYLLTDLVLLLIKFQGGFWALTLNNFKKWTFLYNPNNAMKHRTEQRSIERVVIANGKNSA